MTLQCRGSSKTVTVNNRFDCTTISFIFFDSGPIGTFFGFVNPFIISIRLRENVPSSFGHKIQATTGFCGIPILTIKQAVQCTFKGSFKPAKIAQSVVHLTRVKGGELEPQCWQVDSAFHPSMGR